MFNCKVAFLPKVMDKVGQVVTQGPGRIATMVVYTAIAAVGIVGCAQIKQDFKLEWFIPDDSYVQDFMKLSSEHFASGQRVAFYSRDLDHFQHFDKMLQLSKYMTTSKYVDQDQDQLAWAQAFSDWANTNSVDITVDANTFNEKLFHWIAGDNGARFRTSLKWVDSKCDEGDKDVECDHAKGLKGTRMNAVLKMEYTDEGPTRYDTMVGLRQDCNDIIPPDGEKALIFPFDFQFMYWEEVGIVGQELWRNLLICAVVIAAVVFFMIPQPRIAAVVMLIILFSIAETVGFCHFWGVTISGVSSIYILICVGLAVDYSAHVAHMFKESCGSAPERARQAMVRIGPSVFNAIISTGLAVVILAFSKSFVFRVFFKVIFLVLILAGSQGLVFLPAVLSLVGGAKEGEAEGGSGQKVGPGNGAGDSAAGA